MFAFVQRSHFQKNISLHSRGGLRARLGAFGLSGTGGPRQMLLRSRYEKCPANGSKNKLKTAPEMSPNGFNNASGTTSHSVPKLAPASRPLDMTFCCYLLHLSKLSHLWKCPILGHILGPISCLKASKSTFRMWSKKRHQKVFTIGLLLAPSWDHLGR